MTTEKFKQFNAEFRQLCSKYGFDHTVCITIKDGTMQIGEAILKEESLFLTKLLDGLAEMSRQLAIPTVEFGKPQTEN